MFRSMVSKVMWVGRATVFLVGLAVILALVFGAASMALGANGKPFILGKKNTATKVSKLVRNAGGPALGLQVGAGKPPLTVNAAAGKAINLNADEVDGQSLECPNGTLFHEGVCIETSKRSPASFSQADRTCLDEGKRLATIAELQTFRNRSGHDFTTGEWTNDVESIGSSAFAAGTAIFPNGGRANSTDQMNYRCVQPPL